MRSFDTVHVRHINQAYYEPRQALHWSNSNALAFHFGFSLWLLYIFFTAVTFTHGLIQQIATYYDLFSHIQHVVINTHDLPILTETGEVLVVKD